MASKIQIVMLFIALTSALFTAINGKRIPSFAVSDESTPEKVDFIERPNIS